MTEVEKMNSDSTGFKKIESKSTGHLALGTIILILGALMIGYASYVFFCSLPSESLSVSYVNEQGEEFKYSVVPNQQKTPNNSEDNQGLLNYLFTWVGGELPEKNSYQTVDIRAENTEQLNQMMGWYQDSLNREYMFASIRAGLVAVVGLTVLLLGASVLQGKKKLSDKKEDDGSGENSLKNDLQINQNGVSDNENCISSAVVETKEKMNNGLDQRSVCPEIISSNVKQANKKQESSSKGKSNNEISISQSVTIL